MFRKLILLLIFLSINVHAMENKENKISTTKLEKDQIIPFLQEGIEQSEDHYIPIKLKKPSQLMEYINDLITSRDVTKEIIIEEIQKAKIAKKVQFMEIAIFKAIFNKNYNILSWLQHGLDTETENSISDILLNLIAKKFAVEDQRKAVDKLIGFAYKELIEIYDLSSIYLKAITFAMLFIMLDITFDNNRLKNELIKNSIQALYNVVYAPEAYNSDDNTAKQVILIKFLAKICAYGHLTLREFEEEWERCYEEYKKRNRSLITEILKESHKEADQNIKNILKEKCERFKLKHMKYSKIK